MIELLMNGTSTTPPGVDAASRSRLPLWRDTLEEAFGHRYPGFRPANDDGATASAS
jgi:hypothetical protein